MCRGGFRRAFKRALPMTRHAHGNVFAVLMALGLAVPPAAAQCAPFYDSLNDAASIESNGGVITGPLGFAPAVNESGAVFNGDCHVTYTSELFAAPRGSVSLWFRKISTDADGGILQIGTLGQPNSIGVFYVQERDVYFEVRNDSSHLAQVSAPGALSQTEWTHIVAAWRSQGDGCDMWLFVNGRFVTYGYLPGLFDHTADTMQIGVTGYYGNAEGMMDELRLFDWKLLDSEVYAEYVYSSNRYRNEATGKPVSTGAVRVIGKSVFVNGEPFTVEGVGYAPTPIGFWPWEYSIYTDPDILARDIPLLEGMNANTIRTWAPPPNTILLDALYYDATTPIYAVIGFWIPLNGLDDYGDPATIAFYESEFRDFVRRFKNHPAALGWGIGNEVNLGLEGQALADWYALANRLAEVAYEEEGAAYHPTIVVNGGMWGLGNVDASSDDVSMNFVDMWGHNTYFGEEAHCYFDYYDRLSAKPLIFTEFGIDAYDNITGTEYQAVQAEYVVQQWRQIRSGCAGGTVMAYSDEWWKAGDPSSHDFGGYATDRHPDGFSNEEWWGMLSVEDNGNGPDLMSPRLAYYALAQEYGALPGDVDGDGDVDLFDLAALLVAYGACVADPNYNADADFDASGCVDLADLAALLADYGTGTARRRQL